MLQYFCSEIVLGRKSIGKLILFGHDGTGMVISKTPITFIMGLVLDSIHILLKGQSIDSIFSNLLFRRPI